MLHTPPHLLCFHPKFLSLDETLTIAGIATGVTVNKNSTMALELVFKK